MKSTKKTPVVQLDQVLDICVDVSKDKLNAYFELGDLAFDDELPNTTRQIEKKLREYARMAKEHGLETLRVICEPSGGYQSKLLRTARRLGHLTAYVNGEAVAKFRVVETNDNGKTDLKDPHIIHTLASINKVLRHRELTDEYLLLRKTGVLYDQADRAIVSVRCRLHRSLVELFCDYSFSNDFLYSNSGRALMDKYGCNPYRIVRAGRGRFERAMRRRAPRIQQRSLDRLWRDASNSARHQFTPEFTDLLEMATRQLWEEFLLHEERKTDFANRMISLLDRLRAKDPKIPEPTPGVISAKNLARLLAETGPLDDFTSWRMLLRYAGLNIQMRQSGQYKGQYKIPKKGRPLLRKILAQIVLPLVRKKSLYGEFYHGKRVTMPGQKAMTVVMRLFLRKLHGWYRAGEAFNEERHFTCSASYTAKQAA
jgi:transposase